MNYFETTKDGQHFIRDLFLGFDPDNLPFSFGKHFDWSTAVEVYEIKDNTIDISNIPPSLFLMAVTNTYSRGFDLYITADCSFQNFAKQTANAFHEYITKEDQNMKKITNLHDICKSVPCCLNLNVSYLHQNGIIKSSKDWNQSMLFHGLAWWFSDDDKIRRSIEGIVIKCNELLQTLK